MQPQTPVAWYPDSVAATKASHIGFGMIEPAATTLAGGSVDGIVYGAPADQVALQALETNIRYGFENLADSLAPRQAPAKGSTVGFSATPAPSDDGDILR